jgi:hypothetical protein
MGQSEAALSDVRILTHCQGFGVLPLLLFLGFLLRMQDSAREAKSLKKVFGKFSLDGRFI